eukprot:2898996-Amphidinium_carterae.1
MGSPQTGCQLYRAGSGSVEHVCLGVDDEFRLGMRSQLLGQGVQSSHFFLAPLCCQLIHGIDFMHNFVGPNCAVRFPRLIIIRRQRP